MSHEAARAYVAQNETADAALAEFLRGSDEVRAAIGTTALWRVVARIARAWEGGGRPCAACALTEVHGGDDRVGDAYAHTCGRRP